MTYILPQKRTGIFHGGLLPVPQEMKIPSVIPDISNRESRVVAFSSVLRIKTLDSCFRRNDSLGVFGYFHTKSEDVQTDQ